jgi:hypothetical protein
MDNNLPDKLNVSPAAIISGAVLISGISAISSQMPPSLVEVKIPQSGGEQQQEQLAATISFWTQKVGAHIIEYDSVNKTTFHDEWSTEDDTAFDINYYMANFRKAHYKKGFAVRTGKLNRGPYKDSYLISIDFDTLEAFLTWCAEDYDLDTLAKWTRVDWHKNPARVHAFFISKTPLKDLARSNGNQIIEIYGKNPHLVCAYGNHKDGNPIVPYDTKEIAVIDNITKLEIENRVKLVIPNYLDGDAVNKYVEELEKPETIIPKGVVHHAVRTMLMSVYFRWSNGFADKTDEQRFQYVVDWDKQKAIQANRPAYIDANPRKLEELWEGIKKKYQGQRQEERDKREEAANSKKTGNRGFDEHMPGCICYETIPGRFIVGTPDNKIAEISRKFDVDEKTGQERTLITYITTFTACKPIKIIRHINPLPFMEIQDKYTIEFIGSERSGCFTIKHKSLSEIVSVLKNGNALAERGIDIALQGQIKGLERSELLEVNDSMNYTGFFPCGNNNKIISSNVDIPEEYPDVTDALKFIDELLEERYKGREDLLSHICHWFMIAPFSFIFKVVNAPLLDWVHLYGNPNTGKSTSGLIGLAFDGNGDEEFILNMKHIDSPARFGNTISNTTFPKIINEVDLTERPDVVTDIITAIDAIIFRKPLDRNRIAEPTPGLAPLFLTGNPQVPTKPEYIKRVKTRHSTEKEIHFSDSPEAIEYKKWLAANIKRAYSLGRFRNKFVMEHQDIILDANLTPFEKSRKIWAAIYESVGRKLPSFIDKKLEEHQMQDSVEDRKVNVLNALEAWIVDRCRTLDTNRGEYGDGKGEKKILDQYQESINRLAELVRRNLIPYVKRDRDDKIIFFRQVTVELERFGVKQLDLPGLADAIPGAEYGKLWNGRYVVKCSIVSLTAFFDGTAFPEKEKTTTTTK